MLRIETHNRLVEEQNPSVAVVAAVVVAGRGGIASMAVVRKATAAALDERCWRRPGRYSKTRTSHERRQHNKRQLETRGIKRSQKTKQTKANTLESWDGEERERERSGAAADEPEFRDAERDVALARSGVGLSQGPHRALRPLWKGAVDIIRFLVFILQGHAN